MKTLKYVWRNVRRNKLRTALTILSVGFSLALMTVLHGYMAMQDAFGVEALKHNRIVVMNTQGFTGALPIAYVDRVRGMDHVKAAVPYSWYGGIYKEETMAFAQFATDPAQFFDVWSEFKIKPDELKAWQENRQGCVADRRLAERRGWEIGERIPLQGTIYPYDLDLVLCGTYDSPQNTSSIVFHWNYLEEGLKQSASQGSGNAGTIFARIDSPEAVPAISAAIDDRFASSDNPTRTQTEAAFAQMFADMLGNLEAYIRNIGLAVVFSLSLVAANSMAMSMRERTTEIAVLKAIGFSRRHVMVLVMGEACGIALLGGIFGVAIGCGFLETLHNLIVQFFPVSLAEMNLLWLLYLLLAAIGIGFMSGIVPAVRAAQTSVVNGLRKVI